MNQDPDVQTLLDEINALRKALAWMDLVMANLSDSVFVIDENWKITFVNDSLSEMVGVIRVLLLGRYAWEAVPLVQDGKTLKVMIKEPRISVKHVAKLNGQYALNSFKVSRILDLHCTYIPNLRQAVCILTDTTIETRAIVKLREITQSLHNG